MWTRAGVDQDEIRVSSHKGNIRRRVHPLAALASNGHRLLQLLPGGVACEEGRGHDQVAVAQDSDREVAEGIALGPCRRCHAECAAERPSCEGRCRRRKNFAPRKCVGPHQSVFGANSANSRCHALPLIQAPSNRYATISGGRCELHIKSRSTTWCVEALHRRLDALTGLGNDGEPKPASWTRGPRTAPEPLEEAVPLISGNAWTAICDA